MGQPNGVLHTQADRCLHVFLRGPWIELDITIALIPHDVEEAIRLDDRMLVMEIGARRAALEQTIGLPQPRYEASTLTPTGLSV
ncbi:MAG: hypothetical protein M1522_08595 [Actinobacteria bacterium]|nr:hypothetical protein [Actinomycetota bacterium]